MQITLLAAILLSAPLAAGYLVAPPTGSTAAPLTVTDCSAWVVVTSSMTCTSITSTYGITITNFEAMNPILGTSCQLLPGFAFCIQENFITPGLTTITTTTTSTTISTLTTTPLQTSSTATTTSSGNGITTSTPYQANIISSCSTFHLVVTGDQCGTIASAASISLSDFYLWNPSVGNTCASLWLGYYVCIGILTSTSTSISSVTTTTAGNGIATPTPYQSGMTTQCSSFHLVISGDQCGTLASAAGISLDNFYLWNPAVGSSCGSLWLGYYVCINVIGGTTSTSTTTVAATTTSEGNGVATPTPYETGMITSCDAFHMVVTGDQCGLIATAAGISLDDFYTWNPTVGSTCESLWLGYYVCIGVL